MDCDKIFDDFYKKLSKNHFYRGYMIDSFAMVEKQIDVYLAEYFNQGQEKIFELGEILIDCLLFEAKRTALKTILDNKSKNFKIQLVSSGKEKTVKYTGKPLSIKL